MTVPLTSRTVSGTEEMLDNYCELIRECVQYSIIIKAQCFGGNYFSCTSPFTEKSASNILSCTEAGRPPKQSSVLSSRVLNPAGHWYDLGSI